MTRPDNDVAVVFRGATVVPVTEDVIHDGDVLVVGDRIAAVGRNLAAPAGATEIDADGGILMPGMIDTHRHMWQTNLRGLGADWTLSEYFTFYYLNWGKYFRPEDIYAGNLLSGIESVDAGVTTTVDWSHGLRTIDHGEAAADALLAAGGRFVLAYGNLLGGPWEWSTDPAFHAFVQRRRDSDLLALQMAFDVTSDPAFPERAAFQAARELGLRVTTHAGVWEATNDVGIQQMWDGGFMDDTMTYVHCSTLSADSYHRIAATGGTASVATESECSAGQGYSPTFALRHYDIPISLSQDTSVWWSGDMFAAMRATLNADRVMEHFEAHAEGKTVTNHYLRAEQVVEYATRGGAKALGLDSVIGSVEPGKKADLVLIKNDNSPVSFPVVHPYGHVVFQAQRGDVHTVLVNGKVVKYDHRLVGVDLDNARRAIDETITYLKGELGPQEWESGMNPEIPEHEVLNNPYTYTGAEAWKGSEQS